MVTVYAHLKDIKVGSGDTVNRGAVGTAGTSGRAEGPALYFEVRSKLSRATRSFSWIEKLAQTRSVK
jgi:murein DD-endopeptidase MepM/ murein hydrolase activator NlpD